MGTEPSFSTEQKPILHTERKQTMKMKMQTNRIKRILSAILLLLLAVGMVTSCTKQTPKIEQPDNTTGEQTTESTPTQTTESTSAQTTETTSAQTTENQNPSIEPPDEVLLGEIKADFIRYTFGEVYNPDEEGKIVSILYYGRYNDFEIVRFDINWITSCIEYEIEIGGNLFRWPSDSPIYVWSDDRFFELKEAYEQNLLTQEQVAAIYTIHEARQFLIIKEK